jgi:hypothetical protein
MKTRCYKGEYWAGRILYAPRTRVVDYRLRLRKVDQTNIVWSELAGGSDASEMPRSCLNVLAQWI